MIGWREKNASVCLSVYWRECVLTIFYSPQAPMKRVWKTFFPKLIQQNSASHYVKGRSSLQTLGFEIGTEWIKSFFGYMLINPSHDVVVSFFRYLYSKSVRLEEFKSVENDYLNGDVTLFFHSDHLAFFRRTLGTRLESKYKPYWNNIWGHMIKIYSRRGS